MVSSDGSGWYQLLRKLKKGPSTPCLPPVTFLSDDLYGRSISSLSVHPDRAKGYLLVLALPSLRETKEANGDTGVSLTSSILKLYDLGSYRFSHSDTIFMVSLSLSLTVRCTPSMAPHFQQHFVVHHFLLMEGTPSFSFVLFLLFEIHDRFVICPCIDKTPDGRERFHVRAWDSQSGHIQDSFLNGEYTSLAFFSLMTLSATIPYPFLPRSISWHPSQHMIAISMVGPGAAIGIYSANKPRSVPDLSLSNSVSRGDLAAHRLELTSGTDFISDLAENDENHPYNHSSSSPLLSKPSKGTPSERMFKINSKLKSKALSVKTSGPGGGSDGASVGSPMKQSPARPSSSSRGGSDFDAEKIREKRTTRTMSVYPSSLSPPYLSSLSHREILEKIKAAKAQRLATNTSSS
jgi:hypothetical protein